MNSFYLLKHLLLIHLSLSALISSQFSLHYFCHFSAHFITSILELKAACKHFITILVYDMSFKRHSCATEIAFTRPKLQKVNYRVVCHESVHARNML